MENSTPLHRNEAAAELIRNSASHDDKNLLLRDSYFLHLNLIQAVINRMNSNSFLLKGWSVTLSAGIFMLAAKDSSRNFIFVALLPAVAFFGLDAYYLNLEKRFRCLYEDARLGKVEILALSVAKYPQHFCWQLLNPTVCVFHVIIIVAILISIVLYGT